MSLTNRSVLLEKTNLVKECVHAYSYAVETIQNNNALCEDLCLSCAEVCYQCAEECLQLDDDLLGKELHEMCLKYAELCKQIFKYQTPSQQDIIEESV